MPLAARTRYLVAMGLLPAGVHVACNRDAPPKPVPDVVVQPLADGASEAPPAAVSVTPSATASSPASVPAPSAQPSFTVTRHDGGAGVWSVEVRAAPPTDRPAAEYPRATCPNGRYCVLSPGGAPPASSSSAAAPSSPAKGAVPRTLRTGTDDDRAPAPFNDCLAHGRGHGINEGFDVELTKLERETTPNACCYHWWHPCPGGRALRGEDGVALAEHVAREDWCEASASAARDLDDDARAHLAGYWLTQAASEHASVASFNRFTLQLLALGAPADLVRDAQLAALDEITHAELCYGIAGRYTQGARGPGKLALPTGELPVDPVTVTRETLRDGCLGEAVAAEVVREASMFASDVSLAASLRQVASDEERHAELAWRTVAWLLAEHGAVVRAEIASFAAALAEEEEQLSADQTVCVAGASRAAALRSHGVLDAAHELSVRRTVVRGVVSPCLDALLEERRAA